MVYIRRLQWDAWNVAHIARHQAAPEEVEEVCRGDPVELESYKQRIVLIGPTTTGRTLAMVLGPIPGAPNVYYAFTARPASRRERRYYQEQKGGAEA